jgi:hypothetical protein
LEIVERRRPRMGSGSEGMVESSTTWILWFAKHSRGRLCHTNKLQSESSSPPGRMDRTGLLGLPSPKANEDVNTAPSGADENSPARPEARNAR